MKSRVSKSDPTEAVSLLVALDELSRPLPRTEITMDTLAAIARSSRTLHAENPVLPWLDPAAVRALPKGSRAFIVVATNAGDEHHAALTLGVLRADGARCTKTVYATRKSLG